MLKYIMNNVCFDKSYFTILIILITAIAFYNWYSYHNHIKKLQEIPIVTHSPANFSLQEASYPEDNVITTTSTIATPTDIITEYDYGNIMDPLQQPGRRASRFDIGPMIHNPHFNIPTRGYPDTFSLQGYLVSDDEDPHDPNRIIRLYGRQTYPTSYEWEYYVEVNVANDKLKTDLHRQRREIFNGDKVYVPLIKKNYTASLLKNNTLEYNPFIW
jgi:hypothetical protein